MLAAAKMDDSLANGEKKWNCPTARNNNDYPERRQETDIFEWMNDSDLAFSNHGGQANDRSFYEEVSGYQTNAFVACTTSTLQIMDTGRFTQVTPRSATAKERMNQFVVVCNLLLLAMIKITQLFPNKPKKVKNQPTIPNQPKSIVDWLWDWIWIYKIKIYCQLGVLSNFERRNYKSMCSQWLIWICTRKKLGFIFAVDKWQLMKKNIFLLNHQTICSCWHKYFFDIVQGPNHKDFW